MKLRCLIPLFAFALIACSSDPVEPTLPIVEETLITTSERSYTLEKLANMRRTHIAINFANTSDDTLYISKL